MSEEYEEEVEDTFNGPWSVAIFMVDRAYGGPEEGGWYYDCGYPTTYICDEIPALLQVVFFTDYDKAREWCNSIQHILDKTANVGRREISSVLSEGRYVAMICDGFPERFPKVKPHYE